MMNELIKELLLKAGFTNAYTDPKEGFELVFVDEDHTLESVTKFAELIVRECLKEIKDMIVDESEQLYPNNKQTTEFVNDRLLDAYDNIKEHFGVEE